MYFVLQTCQQDIYTPYNDAALLDETDQDI
jgi:hypothetical protein